MRPRLPRYQGPHSSGQAFTFWRGKRVYLGSYNSPASHEAFNRFVAAVLAGKAEPENAMQPVPANPVYRLVGEFLGHAEKRYGRRGPDRERSEYDNFAAACQVLLDLFEFLDVAAFGPRELEAARDYIAKQGCSRSYVNAQFKRIRRVFRWGVSRGIVPSENLIALNSVDALRPGESDARETKEVQPIADSHVEATLPFLPPAIALMVELQRTCGMRPQEVCLMRVADLDASRTEAVIYRPHRHKTAAKGKVRIVAIVGEISRRLREWMKASGCAGGNGDSPGPRYLFRPADVRDWRNAQRRATRKSPLTPSQRARGAKNRQRFGERYTTQTYRQAIRWGIRAANKLRQPEDKIPEWSPNQLRHAAAREAAANLGPMAAQTLLGHSRLDTTNIYLAKQVEDAIAVASTLNAKLRVPVSDGNALAKDQPRKTPAPRQPALGSH